MAHDSTHHSRIVPAIPLNFKKQNSVKAPTAYSKVVDGPSATLTPDVKAPLTPESAASFPVRAAAEVQTPSEPSIQPNTDAHGHRGVVEDANAQVSRITPLRTGVAPATPDSTPPRAESDRYSDENEAATLDRSPVAADTVSPLRSTPQPRQDESSQAETDNSPSLHTNSGEFTMYRHESETGSRSGAHKLVFGDMSEEYSPSPVSFPPTHELPPPSFPPPAINVAAPPFYPAGSTSDYPTTQTTTAYQTYPPPPVSFATYGPARPWFPQGVGPYPAAPVPFAHAMNPSESPIHEDRHQRQEPQEGPHRGRHEGPFTHDEITRHMQQQENTEAQQGTIYGKSTPASVEVPALNDYVLSQFGQLDFVDCVLEVYLANGSPVPLTRVPLHRIFAARSPRLAAELSMRAPAVEFDAFGMRVLRLVASQKFTTIPGLTEALRHLYGATLPDLHHPDMQGGDTATAALGLAGAGRLLQLPNVEQHGLLLAQSVLDLTNIEVCLAYVSESGSSLQGADDNGAGSVAFQAFSSACIEFLASIIPSEFSFDPTAPQLSRSPRLPSNTTGSRSSVSNPRLSQIQFGEIEEPDQSQDEQALISSILISLPFESLNALFEHSQLRECFDSSTLPNIQHSVVGERERRRVKAARASKGAKHQHHGGIDGKESLYDNLQWVERLDHSAPDGHLVLSRTRKQGASNASTPTTKG